MKICCKLYFVRRFMIAVKVSQVEVRLELVVFYNHLNLNLNLTYN
jgi:hypothetical protein